jgi:hypothetical protein
MGTKKIRINVIIIMYIYMASSVDGINENTRCNEIIINVNTINVCI